MDNSDVFIIISNCLHVVHVSIENDLSRAGGRDLREMYMCNVVWKGRYIKESGDLNLNDTHPDSS